MPEKVVWKLEVSQAPTRERRFGIRTMLGIFLAGAAIFAGGLLVTELANIVWGPFSRMAYTISAIGTGALFLFLAQVLVRRWARNRDGGDCTATIQFRDPDEASVIELGLDRVGDICRSWVGYFLIFFVVLGIGRLLRWSGVDKADVTDSFFLDMLLSLAKGFALPLVVVGLIVVVLGLLEKRKRAAR